MTNKAVVVFSGGQDSTTCLGWALARYEEVRCITFDYGQRHAREVQAAQMVRRHFERQYGHPIAHEIVHVPGVLVSASPITSATPLETYANVAEMTAKTEGRAEPTFVPMRNTLFLTIAANRAVAAGPGTHIVTGVCQEDFGGYADCREVFLKALANAFSESLGSEQWGYAIEAPLMHLTKADTVRLALSLPHTYAALAYSHTAYDGAYPPAGRDHASVLRAHGFEQAGVPDPLVLRAAREGLMPLPNTHNYHAAAAYTADLYTEWDVAQQLTALAEAKPGVAVEDSPLWTEEERRLAKSNHVDYFGKPLGWKD